jgi:hypothetical protein
MPASQRWCSGARVTVDWNCWASARAARAAVTSPRASAEIPPARPRSLQRPCSAAAAARAGSTSSGSSPNSASSWARARASAEARQSPGRRATARASAAARRSCGLLALNRVRAWSRPRPWAREACRHASDTTTIAVTVRTPSRRRRPRFEGMPGRLYTPRAGRLAAGGWCFLAEHGSRLIKSRPRRWAAVAGSAHTACSSRRSAPSLQFGERGEGGLAVAVVGAAGILVEAEAVAEGREGREEQ